MCYKRYHSMVRVWKTKYNRYHSMVRVWKTKFNRSRENELTERIPVPHDNFFKIYLKFARAAKVIFVCCFRDPRGLLSRERDMFRRQTFEVWQPL